MFVLETVHAPVRTAHEVRLPAGTSSDLDCLLLNLASLKYTCDKWQSTTDHHDDRDDVERGYVVRACGSPEAGNQYWTNNTTCAPCCEHNAIDGTCILWPEEIGSKSWHRAKASTVAQSNQ